MSIKWKEPPENKAGTWREVPEACATAPANGQEVTR